MLPAEWERERQQRAEAAELIAREERRAAAQRRAGIDPRNAPADMRTIKQCFPLEAPEHRQAYEAAVEVIDKLVDGFIGMVAMLGPRGTGKSYLCSAAVTQFLRLQRRAAYRRLNDLFFDIKATFNRDAKRSQRDVMNEYASWDLLVLDETKYRAETEWEDALLTDLVDRRYSKLRATILIANLTASEFAVRMGDSIVSRLRHDGGIVVCSWPSIRPPSVGDNE